MTQDPGAMIEQARAALARGAYAKAARLFEAAAHPAAGATAAPLWRAIGQARHMARDAAGALAAFETAQRLEAAHPGACLGRGHALRALGRTPEAVAAYHAALALAPSLGEAWWSLAAVKTYRFSDQETAALRSLTAAPDAPAAAFYALGKALDDQGDCAQAFAAWTQGGRLRQRSAPYALQDDQRFAAALRNAFTPAQIARLSVVPTQPQAPRPVFIVGLPRAGSTLLERILAAHSQVAAADEPPYLGQAAAPLQRRGFPGSLGGVAPADLETFAKTYRAALAEHAEGKPVVVDKNPSNHWLIGLIACAMPDATVIYARREPKDQCLSAFGHHFARGFPFTTDLVALGGYWLLVDQFIQSFAVDFPNRIHVFDYEQLIADQEGETRRLLAVCGLDWQPACLAFHATGAPVHTASAEQVNRPLYASSIGLWLRYEAHLGPLLDALNAR